MIQQKFKVGLAPVAMFALCDDLFSASGLVLPIYAFFALYFICFVL